ncbi:hypothetical protein [Marivirga sp.]|uniref:hypothetical protein n=1 Tax=Marivirga sp. TaxID=2018662 RepID=UPI0025EFDFB5|nr:hypothetical protein [Marivirga sp.]
MHLKFLLSSILFFSLLFCQAQDDLSVTDSLRLIYSNEEIQNMSFDEIVNAVRKMRGQELLFQSPKTDYLGIEIIEDIDKGLRIKEIQNYVSKTNKNLSKFNQYIFPNSYIDVLNGYFMRFYKNPKTRELRVQDYKNFSIEFPDGQGGEVSYFSNFSKRVYYLNEANKVVKVHIQYAFNINEGQKMNNTEMKPVNYESKEYYYQNDSLVLYKEINGSQNIDKYYYLIKQEELDTTKVEVTLTKKYFYKYNCFLNLEKEETINPKDWKEGLKTLELDTISTCNNKYALEARNILLELEEFRNSENEYLQPTENSFLSPYEINASDD